MGGTMAIAPITAITSFFRSRRKRKLKHTLSTPQMTPLRYTQASRSVSTAQPVFYHSISQTAFKPSLFRRLLNSCSNKFNTALNAIKRKISSANGLQRQLDSLTSRTESVSESLEYTVSALHTVEQLRALDTQKKALAAISHPQDDFTPSAPRLYPVLDEFPEPELDMGLEPQLMGSDIERSESMILEPELVSSDIERPCHEDILEPLLIESDIERPSPERAKPRLATPSAQPIKRPNTSNVLNLWHKGKKLIARALQYRSAKTLHQIPKTKKKAQAVKASVNRPQTTYIYNEKCHCSQKRSPDKVYMPVVKEAARHTVSPETITELPKLQGSEEDSSQVIALLGNLLSEIRNTGKNFQDILAILNSILATFHGFVGMMQNFSAESQIIFVEIHDLLKKQSGASDLFTENFGQKFAQIQDLAKRSTDQESFQLSLEDQDTEHPELTKLLHGSSPQGKSISELVQAAAQKISDPSTSVAISQIQALLTHIETRTEYQILPRVRTDIQSLETVFQEIQLFFSYLQQVIMYKEGMLPLIQQMCIFRSFKTVTH
jgi:hypothetical protein